MAHDDDGWDDDVSAPSGGFVASGGSGGSGWDDDVVFEGDDPRTSLQLFGSHQFRIQRLKTGLMQPNLRFSALQVGQVRLGAIHEQAARLQLHRLLFGLRFLVQWVATERARASIIPETFWYFSFLGGLMLFIYAIYRMDPVFILGQGSGLFIASLGISLALARRPAS